MWPFAKRGSRFDGDADEHFPSDIDPEDFKDNTATIKLWLPTNVLAGVDIISQSHLVGRPDVIRAILFEHVYGRADLIHLETRERRRKSEGSSFHPLVEVTLESRRTLETIRAATVTLIGKAEHDFKLELPTTLREELIQLAEGANQPLSEYIRGVLVRQILGEKVYQRWAQALRDLQ